MSKLQGRHFMKLKIAVILFCIIYSFMPQVWGKYAKLHQADVIIYGGTSAAVISAVQIKKLGKSVIIVSPDEHLGGMSSSGLGFTDVGDNTVIGGMSREFYSRIYRYYENPKSWKFENKTEFSNKGQGLKGADISDKTMWVFEPHIAEQVFEDFIRENKIPVFRDEYIDRENGVIKKSSRIISIQTLSGNKFKGKVFIDATYEGDLMASAGVSYYVGREGNSVYNERWNGVQLEPRYPSHLFGKYKVSAYTGDSKDNIIARVVKVGKLHNGYGDKKIQAYNFRLCLTNDAQNRVAFSKPEGYDASKYELFVRLLKAGYDPMEVFKKFDRIPNKKTDTNNHGPFSTDNIGMNWDYPEASYDRRKKIIKEHELYTKGFLWFLATDVRIPISFRKEFTKWGYAKDEFIDNDNFPYQLYIREARRMIGSYVMTEYDVLPGNRNDENIDSIGLGSYIMDSHHVQRFITKDGFVENEGVIGVKTKSPYKIAYGSILPQKKECANLIVPVAVSASHSTFGTIRMEPVFMVLGQSAGIIASISIDGDTAVQDTDYKRFKELAEFYKQKL